MNQQISCLTMIFILFSLNLSSQSNDKEKVEEVIVNSYIHGLIDAKDFRKAREGIHEDFIILGHRDTLLTKKTRDEWIEQRKKRQDLPEVSYAIVYIDVEGDAASVKLELQRESLFVVDYVFLYKFNERWRIVTAIDHAKQR